MNPPGWDVIVGLEVHARLQTSSKMFSSAPATFSTEPNINANELDFGLPGTLPVANRSAVAMAIKFGLAVNGQIAAESEFARKHYFYPDLPKGYQISQYDRPVISGGSLAVEDEGGDFQVALVRAHLEEDAGKMVHDILPGASAIDYNRAGMPLLEIVTEPVLRGAKQAVAFARTLHKLVRWLEICNGNMQEGSLRFDVNVSLRRQSDDELGTRCEIKNLNSFRFLEQATIAEATRQAELLERGDRISQETRLFDTATGRTRKMRSKEEAEDYRYLPDPDLPPLRIDDAWIAATKDAMPELPAQAKDRFQSSYGLAEYDARVLTAERAIANYFETAAAAAGDPKLAANWVAGNVAALVRERNADFASPPVAADRLGGLLAMIKAGSISGTMGKDLLNQMCADLRSAEEIATAQGLRLINDQSELAAMMGRIIADHQDQASQYRAGKTKLLGFFVGQAMKETSGQANPQKLNEIAREILNQK